MLSMNENKEAPLLNAAGGTKNFSISFDVIDSNQLVFN